MLPQRPNHQHGPYHRRERRLRGPALLQRGKLFRNLGLVLLKALARNLEPDTPSRVPRCAFPTKRTYDYYGEAETSGEMTLTTERWNGRESSPRKKAPESTPEARHER
jgi:hypothetical protein